MRNYFFITILILFFGGCSIFKSNSDLSEKRITSFSFNKSREEVVRALVSVLTVDGLKIKNSIEDAEILTETKKIRERDDVYYTLNQIADLPRSPLSEYTEAFYRLSVKIQPENNKTRVSIKNFIEATERGRFNRIIALESSGGKEKEILSKMLQLLR